MPLFSETYQLPVKDWRQMRAVCDPSVPLQPGELQLHEDLSPRQGGDRFDRIERRIRSVEAFQRELVTGHSGSGKSTELLRLASELRKPKNGRAFHVVYLDANDYLGQWGVRLPQLIVALVAALGKTDRVDLRKTRTAAPLFERIKKIAISLGGEVATKLEDVTSVPLLSAILRANQELSGKFRDYAALQTQELLEHTTNVIHEVSQSLRVDLVFVVDNLEKLPEQTIEQGASLHDTLFVRELPLLDLPAHLVLTYPISLNYSAYELGRSYPRSTKTVLPMVSVRAAPGEEPRGDDEAGIDLLVRLLGRRIDLDGLFDNRDTVRHLARTSGGCVRDLLRIASELPIRGEPPFSRVDVDEIAADFANDYARLIDGKAYVPWLPEVAASGQLGERFTSEWKREILLGLVALEYDTDTWFDVHPLVKRTRAYRRVESQRG